MRAALRDYRGYFGRYEVNKKEKYIIHHVEGSVLPGLVGQHLKRSFKLSGNRLIFEAEESANGERGMALITFERVK